MMCATITVRNSNPDTIYNTLARELGRKPTNAECRERILEIIGWSKKAKKSPIQKEGV